MSRCSPLPRVDQHDGIPVSRRNRASQRSKQEPPLAVFRDHRPVTSRLARIFHQTGTSPDTLSRSGSREPSGKRLSVPEFCRIQLRLGEEFGSAPRPQPSRVHTGRSSGFRVTALLFSEEPHVRAFQSQEMTPK